GWNMFIFRAASGAYTSANILVLGLLASPIVVAFYGGADRIARALLLLFVPISQALYPRVTHMLARDAVSAARFTQSYFVLAGVGATCVAVILVASAPVLISVALGPGYETAVPVLQ